MDFSSIINKSDTQNENDYYKQEFEKPVEFSRTKRISDRIARVTSQIAFIDDDGRVQMVYCRLNGDINKNGKLLHDYHNTPKQAQRVVKWGSIITLGKYSNPRKGCKKEDVTVNNIYRRDVPIEYSTVNDYIKDIKKLHNEYIQYFYIFGNDKVFSKMWWVSTDGKEWNKVSKKLDNL